jgi:HAD superfamily hydrolase (TIGR01509 family)
MDAPVNSHSFPVKLIKDKRYSLCLLKALFFDFDGLIMDTETPEVRAWESMFAEHGLDYPAEFWQHVVGRGPDQLEEKPVERLIRLSGTATPADDLFAEFRRHYFDILEHKPLPGVVQLLSKAHQEGIKMWIVSSSDNPWVTGHVESLGIKDFFEDCVTRERAPRSKPAPDLYLEGLRVSGAKPEEVHVFEDSYNGMVAALDAGLTVTVCPNPTTKHLDFSRATRLVSSLEEELERIS